MVKVIGFFFYKVFFMKDSVRVVDFDYVRVFNKVIYFIVIYLELRIGMVLKDCKNVRGRVKS